MTEVALIDRTILRGQVARFRRAVVKYRAAGGDKLLPFFPNGACTIISWLLTRWLHSKGYRQMEYVQGGSPLLKENIHHGWLVVDGFIVDITADQFGQFPIIVERSTEFHSSFKDP